VLSERVNDRLRNFDFGRRRQDRQGRTGRVVSDATIAWALDGAVSEFHVRPYGCPNIQP